MSLMLDRLRRFRPVGAPGGAGPVGVPEDRRSGVPTELVAVFDALDSVIAECRAIRARAEQPAAPLVGMDWVRAGSVSALRETVAGR